MTNKILCYFIMASSYRENIYKKMNDEIGCDFIFGERMFDIKEMNFDVLTSLIIRPKRKYFIHNKLWIDKGVISFFLNNNYKTLIIGGDAYSITVWIMLVLSRLLGKKIVIWSHGYYGREKRIIRYIKRLMFFFADKIFLYGNYAKDLMIKNKIASSEKLVVLYNSLDYDTQIKERNSLFSESIYQDYFGNNNRNLIFVGRLTKSKHLEMIIDALSILREKGHNYNAVFIGNGDSFDELGHQVFRLGLQKNVWLYGACFNESILAKMIYNADLCISPGNIGLTAIHAMMYGTPIITHNNYAYQGPEFEAIQNHKTGLFFEQNNIISLTQAIDSWFDSVESRETIREACYEVIDTKYNPHNQIEIMKSILALF